MQVFKRSLLTIGVILCIFAVSLIMFSPLYPDTYLIIALQNTLIVPLLWGFTCIAIALFFSKSSSIKEAFKTKIIFGVIIAGLLVLSTFYTLDDAVADVQAVLNDDLYIAEGTVADTWIKERKREKDSGEIEYSYRQYIVLDNAQEDRFSLQVNDSSDYVFEKDATYKIVSLPFAKTILDYEKK